MNGMFRCIALVVVPFSLIALSPTWEDYKKETMPTLRLIEGWCSAEKAEKMMDLIHDTRPVVCVEIGVYGGSSIFPTARALKYHGEAKVYAIDAWSSDICLQGYTPGNTHYEWWRKIDLNQIYLQFKTMLYGYELKENCVIMQMASEKAALLFKDDSIDILHIDGNHSEEVSYSDVVLFLPKVKLGGYIWLNDAHWPSIQKSLLYLQERCRQDPSRSTGTCFLFQKKAGS